MLLSRFQASLVHNQLLRCRYATFRQYSDKSSKPLRILFCGSDEFSVASLKALHDEQRRAPESIRSIDVVCRPGKRVGRGLKTIREVPIKAVASKLDLKIHELDSFTGWAPSRDPIDLIVAVSFGLFIPSRLLKSATYGGINIHPSLLPDLRGPAPLHHTLLSGRKTTGITLQTLHHKHFDHGMILDQTPAPGIPVPNQESCTVSELLEVLAPKGAEMLINGIRNRIFVPPLKEVDSAANARENPQDLLVHAAKITPEDRHIKWNEWTWTTISRRQRVLGPLWSKALIPAHSSDNKIAENMLWKRVIFEDIEEVSPDSLPQSQWLSLLPGVPFAPSTGSTQPRDKALFVYTADGKLLRLQKIKVEGDKTNDATIAAQKAHMFSPKPFRAPDAEFRLFYNPLC